MSNNNSSTNHYTDEFKKSILERLEKPTTETVSSIASELNLSKSTIYQWVRKNNKQATGNNINLKSKNKWTSEDKFHIVFETILMTENQLSEYCRKKGLYVAEVKSWKEQCLNANAKIIEDPAKLKEDLKEEQSKNKRLEKELLRKEKALAETAALLVLRKKANAIWGDPEED